MIEKIKKVLPPAAREAWRAWLCFIRPFLLDLAILRNRIKLSRGEFSLNIGGGRWFRKGWKNLDCYAASKFVHYRLDLRENKPLPIAGGVVRKVFCSHVIEHLSDDSGRFLVHELYRVMKPGGVLRIVCPDSDKLFEAYHQNNTDFFRSNEITLSGEKIGRRLVNAFASYDKGEYSGGPVVDETEVKEKISCLSKEDFIRWCVSMIPKDASYIAHVNGYDFEKMKEVLESSGFNEIKKSSYRSSMDEELRHEYNFDNYPVISLFVECIKPYVRT